MDTDPSGFYAILDVAPNASAQAIRSAFRRRAKELHPDISPHRAEEFIALKLAYDTLANPATRADYDLARRREAAVRAAARKPPPPAAASVAPSYRRPGTISAYVFAFALMSAVALGFVGVLISLGGPPPLPPSIGQGGFDGGGVKTPKAGVADATEGDSAETAEPAEGRSGEAARSAAPSEARPRHDPYSDSEPSW